MDIEYGEPERVLVELEWYDGPRSGICYISEELHRFHSNFDEENDEWLGTFRIAPVSQSIADMEVEQWRIFVEWNQRYESSKATLDTHPATGGVNKRYDELEKILVNEREIPEHAQKAKALLIRNRQEERYSYEGTDYLLRWCKLD